MSGYGISLILTRSGRIHGGLAGRLAWVSHVASQTIVVLLLEGRWNLRLAHLSCDGFSRTSCILLVNESLLVVRKGVNSLLHVFIFHLYLFFFNFYK